MNKVDSASARHIDAVAIIAVASVLAAFLFFPPDPVSMQMAVTSIFATSIASYCLGVKTGKQASQ